MDEKVKQLTNQQVAKLLADNNRQVQDTISGCLGVLEKISSSGITGTYNFKNVVEAIQQILSTELKHSTTLGNLITELAGIKEPV